MTKKLVLKSMGKLDLATGTKLIGIIDIVINVSYMVMCFILGNCASILELQFGSFRSAPQIFLSMATISFAYGMEISLVRTIVSSLLVCPCNKKNKRSMLLPWIIAYMVCVVINAISVIGWV